MDHVNRSVFGLSLWLGEVALSGDPLMSWVTDCAFNSPSVLSVPVVGARVNEGGVLDAGCRFAISIERELSGCTLHASGHIV